MSKAWVRVVVVVALVASSVTVLGASPGYAVTLGSDFGEQYTIADLGTPPGVPGPLGGLTLKRSDPDTLLIGGAANSASGAIYAVPLERAADGSISGFAGEATLYAEAPYIDGGLAYEPVSGVLFYTGYPSNLIGQIRPGSAAPDRVDAVTDSGVVSSVGALTFVPSFAPGTGSLMVTSYNGGGFYTLPFAPDGSGTFDLGAATLGASTGGGPEGIAYVPGGSPGFAAPSVLISEYNAGAVRVYEVDGAGIPDTASRRDFVTGLTGAEGAFMDSSTGEFLFSTFGGGNRVIVVQGFAVLAVADLSLTKEAEVDAVTVGQLVRYKVVVGNAGPDTAQGVVVTDTLPPETTFSDAGAGCVHADGTVTCAVGDLAPGGVAEIPIVATAVAPGVAINTAVVSASSEDPDFGDNNAEVAVTVSVPDEPTERVQGITRIETAVRASETTFNDKEANVVLLARSDTFPDALAGSPLAVALNGPLLLTGSASLHPATSDELLRVLRDGGVVHLLGGTAALSEDVEQAVAALGFPAVRHGGEDRYATAEALAKALPDPKFVIIATGTNFPDALAAGTAAAAHGGVILLTRDDTIPARTQQYLDDNPSLPVHAAGGPAARALPSATPHVGEDRYATAVALATAFFPDPTAIGVATGLNFADALSGAAHLGRRGAPVVLSPPDLLPSNVADYLESRPRLVTAFVFGGPAALSDDVETAVAAALTQT